MRNSYIYVSNKDLSIIKSPLDNIMRGVFDDRGIGVQAKGSIYESSSDMLPKWKYIRTEFGYERVICSLQAGKGGYKK